MPQEKLSGLVLTDKNVLRVNQTNCLRAGRALLLPAEDFELVEHLATSGTVPASAQRLGRALPRSDNHA
jgi:hypothetical protein